MRNNLSAEISLHQVARRLYQPENIIEQSRVTRVERMATTIAETASLGARQAAQRIAELIRSREAEGKGTTLGMVTGRTMCDVYAELVRLHTEEGLSFRNVHIYSAEEFYPLVNASSGCYAQLHDQLLAHIDIASENVTHIDGNIPLDEVPGVCARIEQELDEIGGVDLMLLGVGRAGNIAANEPGTNMNSLTRLTRVDNISRRDAAALFGTVEQVPTSAITMGIGSILKARRIMLLAWGEHKAEIVRRAIEEEPTTGIPASMLQYHPHAEVIVDLPAASMLTRIRYPWLLTSCEWDDSLTRRAIVWLCEKTGKPILKLTNKDYNEYGLSELIARYGSAYDCNIHVFNDLQHTITGWPGGKPNADDSCRPERATPYPKDVLIFSPHPDDDVISMGGTFARLIKQGHNVHVAYETSGCIAVSNDHVAYFMDFMKGYHGLSEAYPEIDKMPSGRELLDVKALIRRGEATAACRHMGLDESHIHFLNLPFYETGTTQKGDLSEADVAIVKQLLLELRPTEMFVAGDLADPHGTHKVCLDAVLAAIDELRPTEEWLKDCRVWMYRGAWMEWEIDLIEMAVPMSPEELRAKRNTILKHQSQMESAPFMGNDERLFWQRAEDRNHATAELYAQLGLANYEAIEAFVQYKMA